MKVEKWFCDQCGREILGKEKHYYMLVAKECDMETLSYSNVQDICFECAMKFLKGKEPKHVSEQKVPNVEYTKS